MTPAQCRAGRALIEMDQSVLARAAGVSRNVIINFEKGYRVPTQSNLAAIRRSLERAGVIFVDENEEGPGVRLRKQRPAGESIAVVNFSASIDG